MKDWLASVTDQNKRHKASPLALSHPTNLPEFTTYILSALHIHIKYSRIAGCISDTETNCSILNKLREVNLKCTISTQVFVLRSEKDV